MSSQCSGVRSTCPRCRSPWIRWTVVVPVAAASANRARTPGAISASSGTTAPAASRRRSIPSTMSPTARWDVPRDCASSACTSATAAPIRCDSPAKSVPTSSARRSASSSRSRTLPSAIDQPSAELAAKSCTIARVVRTPPISASIHARTGATDRQPASPSARCSSTSGLTPGVIRRNSLSSNCSPSTTEVLDCSALSARPRRPSSMTVPGTVCNSTGPYTCPVAIECAYRSMIS